MKSLRFPLLIIATSTSSCPSALAFQHPIRTTTKATKPNHPTFSPSRLIQLSSSSPTETTEPSESIEDYDENNNSYETSFYDLGLESPILSAVKAQPGWDHPTPVQALAIPQLILPGGGDNNVVDNKEEVVDAVWCEAPTGSGKTAAYLLPLLQNLIRNNNPKKNGGSGRKIKSLIICPTRELADQIGYVVRNLIENISVQRRNQKPTCLVVHGGTPLRPQINALADYAEDGDGSQSLDVLIATPGRLVDVLTYYHEDEDSDNNDKNTMADAALERRLLDALDEQETGGGSSLSLEQLEQLQLDDIVQNEKTDGRDKLINLLDGLQYLVFDEADRLLGRAFESEVNAVLDLLPKQSQSQDPLKTWMFSATFPKAIEPRLDHVLKRIGTTKPIRIECTHSDRLASAEMNDSTATLQKKLDRSTTVSSASQLVSSGQSSSTISMRAIKLEKPHRTQALRKLLEENPQWDRVLVFVATRYASEHVSRKLRRVGFRSQELHGKLDQDARERRLMDLKKGKIRVLLTTDIASRGLDIVGLPLVVNYDLPRSTADFVHRVGRTGRAGKSGTAITFVTASNEAHMEMIENRHLKQPIEREVLQGFVPDENRWNIESEGSKTSIPGVAHSDKGLAHDKMFGGIKGRRKSKKDRLREAAAKKAAEESAAK